MDGTPEAVRQALNLYRPMGNTETEQMTEERIPSMESILGPGGVIARTLGGYESRPQQVEMAQTIADAIQGHEHCLVEGGTGVGKSLAYLVPVLYSRKTAVVSTEGKALQDQLAKKDLPFLKSVLDVPVSFAVLKGISNYVCALKWEEETHKLGLLPGFADLQGWHDETISGDLADAPGEVSGEVRAAITTRSDECLKQECPHAAACFYLEAKARAAAARIVIVNHTLLCLDLRLRDETGDALAILPNRDVVVVDEAHNLEDAATQAFTTELSEHAVSRALSDKMVDLGQLDTTDVERAIAVSARFFAALADDTNRLTYRPRVTAHRGTDARVIETLLRSMARHCRGIVIESGGYEARFGEDPNAAEQLTLSRITRGRTSEKKDNLRRELLARRLEDLGTRFLLCAETTDAYVLYAERTTGRRGQSWITLKRAPLCVADDLASALWNRWPTIATSATIATANGFAYFRERTGCPPARELTVGSPFNYRSNALLYLPPNGRDFVPQYQDGSLEYYVRLADQIEHLLMASDGRAFCLFASRRVMQEIHTRLHPRLSWTVLLQGEYSQGETIRRFRADGHAVLFGLKTYWTGVDVAGDALSLVVIDKLPFAQPDDPVFEARKEDLTERTGDRWAWWNQLAIPSTTIALKQGFGRLIRSRSDTGVIAILDGRLTTKNYGVGILRALPPATRTRSLEAVRAFFETH